MIYFLTTRKARYTVCKYLRSHGAELIGRITPVSYDELVCRRRCPPGVYIFADLERLPAATARLAATAWERLAETPGCRLLNRPLRTMRRYELLRTLHDEGFNSFNLYRPDELTPGSPQRAAVRYPVFVRGENDHKGSQTPLLANERELDEALSRLRRKWKGWRPKVVTEFCDTAGTDGIYRKYAAFRVGDRVLARHLFFSTGWSVKAWHLLDERLLAEERRYFDANPHEAELQQIFARAGVEFGRIDYGLVGGRIQVWEINTNPMLPVGYGGGGPAREALHQDFRWKMIAAFRALEDAADSDGRALAHGAWQWQQNLRLASLASVAGAGLGRAA